MKPVNIFIAYARKDKDLLEKLRKPLNVLKRHGHCEIFYDGEIKPGEHWDKRLKNELYRAEIIVLLVTDDFLDSDYVNEVELPKAIELHQQGKAYVLPIILRDCMWRFTRISDLQAILKGDCPIDESDGYAWAALQVAEAIDLIRKRRLPSISTEPMITLSGKPYATESSPYQGVDPFQDSMIIVEGASFDMGNSQPYRPKSQKPPHKAKVATFYISKYLVAREQYLTIMGQTASIKEKNEPMRKVSWEDAWTFIKKLNDLTSKNYGLPTEAE